MNNASTRQMVILVVEDESLIRLEAVDMFEDAGHKVYEASSAKAALAILEQHPEIEVLFTDIDMPGGMNGLELATTVKERWPSTAILVTSGHVKVRFDEMPKDSRFFGKPYQVSDIEKAIEETIGSD